MPVVTLVVHDTKIYLNDDTLQKTVVSRLQDRVLCFVVQ
jgi:hypothetical protein